MLFLIPNTGIAISKTPYTGYTYDAWGKSIPAPSGYECVSVFYPQTTGCGNLNGASDLFVYNGELYIVDTGNNRIAVLDHNYDFVRELNSVMMPDGTESALAGPRGVYLRDETMIVADTGNARVLICDMNRTVRMVLEKPETEFIAEGIAFRPTKVVQDASGFFYVVAEGIYQGILCYDSNGRFAGFFGSNKVKVTLSVIIGQLWKKILSQDQAQSMERYIPVEVANIFIDSDDFIFSLTNGSVGYDRATGTIQRLNPLGVNVLHYNERDVDASGGALYPHDEYGDVEYANIKSKMVDTTFIDVYVDENGVFSALDRERGRIFQYDQESNLLFIFGGIGNQKGSFSIPSAIEKTVVCCNLIARRKVNTLILLESSSLIEQWEKALSTFLILNAELPEYKTAGGRTKKRKSHVGVIHGAKDTSTGIIDIAMVGSLFKKGEPHPRLKEYGMVLVDECHHSASETVSRVLNEVTAKYVYGVTATPFRGDGLEKINEMLIGPVRFSYTAKEKAEEQGIDHLIVPRFTRTVSPHGRDKLHINETYEIIRNNEIRNEQITDDIKACIAAGRTPVILTRFTDHADVLYDRLKNCADNVFLPTGNKSKKKRKKNCVP